MRFVPSFNLSNKIKEEFVDSGAQDEAAEEIAEAARSVAPVDTGAYRDSIHVEDGKVVADVDYAAVVEAGSNDTPIFRPLGRGAEMVVGSDGLRQRD